MPIIGSFGSGSARAFGQRGGAGGTPIDYLVVAGGGSGGGQLSGGGGAGGYRASSYGPAPLQGSQLFIKPETSYTITVGAGAPPGPSSPEYYQPGNRGGNSIIGVGSPIEFSATGGGAGKNHSAGGDVTGGSGGGGGLFGNTGAAGNLGGYTPPEGNPGGDGPGMVGSGGTGGGALNPGGSGGSGAPNDISGSAITYAVGGPGSPGSGTTNRGNGGGGGLNSPQQVGGPGGSGIIYLRFPTASKSPAFSVTPGTNTSSVIGDDTLVTFTVSGTFTL